MTVTIGTGSGARQPSRHEELAAACGMLDDVLNDVAPAAGPSWGLRLGAAAEAAFAAVEGHRRESEGPDGALAEIVQHKPELRFHAERQKREHVELCQRAKELTDEVERQLAFEQVDMEALRMEAVVLRESLRLHIYRAVQLLYEAYFRDEGGED